MPRDDWAKARVKDALNTHILPIDLAFVRWSVVHQNWQRIGGDCPVLTAFLAGWCSRCAGLPNTDPPTLRDSYRAGWVEADSQIVIELRAMPKAELTAINETE